MRAGEPPNASQCGFFTRGHLGSKWALPKTTIRAPARIAAPSRLPRAGCGPCHTILTAFPRAFTESRFRGHMSAKNRTSGWRSGDFCSKIGSGAQDTVQKSRFWPEISLEIEFPRKAPERPSKWYNMGHKRRATPCAPGSPPTRRNVRFSHGAVWARNGPSQKAPYGRPRATQHQAGCPAPTAAHVRPF